MILFVNGLSLVVIELKNPADENATIVSAFNRRGVLQYAPTQYNQQPPTTGQPQGIAPTDSQIGNPDQGHVK